MDCTRYLESRIQQMIVTPVAPKEEVHMQYPGERSLGWMAG
jgi:hypothetical protein